MKDALLRLLVLYSTLGPIIHILNYFSNSNIDVAFENR